MSRVKTQNTDHSYLRAAERCGWGKKKARDIMKLAQRYGKCVGNLDPGPIKNYLAKKQWGNPHKRIKLYENHIFVFASTSTKCITVYPVPDEILQKAGLLQKNETNLLDETKLDNL